MTRLVLITLFALLCGIVIATSPIEEPNDSVVATAYADSDDAVAVATAYSEPDSDEDYCEEDDSEESYEPEPETLQCGLNEVTACVQKCPPEKTCRNRDRQYRCLAVDTPCTPKCICAEGYFRNPIGQCITEAQCDQCSKNNEFYSCGGACDNVCADLDKQNRTICPIQNIKCNEMCYCDDGYARDGQGNCVPVAQCPFQTCGPDEILDECPVDRPSDYCPCSEQEADQAQFQLSDQPLTCAPPQCKCRFNYRRAENGTCIPTRECPPFKCSGKEEEFNACPPLCPSDDCSQATPDGRCPLLGRIGIVLPCSPKCRCRQGYWRKEGVCVPYAECKKECNGPNEEYTLEKRTCPPEECFSLVARINCDDAPPPSPGCACKSGFLRVNATSPCVPICDCPEMQGSPDCKKKEPEPLQCGLNEVSACVQKCPPEKNCRNRDIRFKCLAVDTPCTPKCICAEGYFRNSIGECITEAQCDQCSKKNEFYSCGSACDNVCTDLNKQNRTACPIQNIKCNEWCYCDDGYARDGKGNCVPVAQCPKQCDGPNEEYTLEKRTCPPEECFSLVARINCDDAPPPSPGCACKSGFLRVNATSPCVPICDCPQMQGSLDCKKNASETCGPNEILDKCPVDRPSDYCPCSEQEAGQAQFQLADQPLTCAPPQCKCRFNYRRAENGTCIPTRECPPFKCSGKKEEFNACPPLCPSDDCSQATPDGRCPALLGRIGIVLPCSPKCRCRQGYWRKEGVCVPYAECKKECNGPNEEYTLEKRTCPPEECFSLVARINCADAPPPSPGCACKSGFLRVNATSPCVPICDCPQMQNSPDCKKKEPEPLQCGLNEVSACVQKCPPEKTCRNRDIQFKCSVVHTPCTPKCICAEGYFRNSIGECITEAQCDQCSKKNEFYSCGSACDNVCTDLNKQNRTACPIQNIKCNEWCYCDDGYARDGKGNCVPVAQCPKQCDGPNEEYTLEKRTCPPEECFSLVARINCDDAPPPSPGCACKSGFLRVNATSPCVPICDCPQMQGSLDCKKNASETCGPNEILDKCPVDRPSDYCPCSEQEADQAQFQLSDQPLTCAPPQCKCRFNYRRAENGTCIPTRECPPFKCSGKKEEFNACPPLCPSDDCSQATPDGRCPALLGRIGIVLPCSPKCRCRQGYWRKEGVCVPYAECKKECNGPNEEYTLEKRTCPPEECFSLVARINCDDAPPPSPGCACKSGFLRVNATSPCVPICDCPEMQGSPDCKKKEPEPLQCGLNEVSACVQKCPPEKTCRNRDIQFKCSVVHTPCTPKCICAEGYFRNSIGECITEAQCDQCSKKNEFYSCGSACDNVCTDLDKQNRTACPIQNIKCNEWCYCDDGYARDGKGNCVPVAQCPKQCDGPNEEYTLEKRTCPPEECFSLVARINCDDAPPPSPGCACKSGFLRVNATSPCVPICDCPEMQNSPDCKKNASETCGPNQILDECPVDRPSDYCPCSEQEADQAQFQLSDQPLTCAPPQCKCRFNYRRAKNGTCIPTRECPPFECSGKKEEFNACPPLCPSDDCSQATPDGRCPLLGRIGIVLPCSPKCRCRQGYWRKKGVCVPYAQCKKECNGPNEEYTLEKRTCPPEECFSLVARINCTDAPPPSPGCACKSGFLRVNATSPCVPICDCPQMQSSPDCKKNEPEPLQCGPKEVPACVQKCPPEKNCRNRDTRFKCLAVDTPCTPKCICAKGYFRNSIGDCITEAQCDKCSKKNEFYSCGSACDNVCSNINQQNRTICPIRNIKCNEKCYCDDGYARDRQGNCVPVAQCQPEPEPLQCGSNEVSKCVQECPPEKTCKNRGIQFSCLAVATPCTQKCVCAEGYIRNSNGECIKEAKCEPEPLQCGPNEVSKCVQKCPPEKTCKNRNIQYSCLAVVTPCTQKCICAKGFVRNSIGECVKEAQCDQCSGKNEFYSCNSACDNVCADIDKQNRTNCPIKNKKCNERCYCDDGYARDAGGNCVPVEQCPKKCDGPNEEYTLEKRTCLPDQCFSLVAKIDCRNAPPPAPGCACKSGFLRVNATSPCVPICQCPQMQSSPDCKKNEPEPEPLQCGCNEVSKCVQECPPEKTCKNRGIQFSCLAVDTPCTQKCVCDEGYVRNSNGECIKEAKCEPEPLQCGPNEVSKCVQKCPPEKTCKNRNIQYDCLAVVTPCTEKCICAKGFVRNSIGECVKEAQCAKLCDGPNEEYTLEKRSCPKEECFSLVARIDCRNAPPPAPGCACKSGFLRVNATSPCVPICQCPQIKNSLDCKKKECTGPNEEFTLKKRSCPPEECRSILADYDCRNATTAPGCACKLGFLRVNENSPCVPHCQCPEISRSPECKATTLTHD